MRHICVLLLLILVAGCKNDRSQHADLMAWIPENTSMVTKTTSIEALLGQFKNNSLLHQFSHNNTVAPFGSKLAFLKHLQPKGEVLLALGNSSQDSLQISVLTHYHEHLFNLDSVANHAAETFVSNGHTITKTSIRNEVIYSRIKDSMFFASNDRQLAEAAFDKTKADPLMTDLFPAANNGAGLSIFINTKQKAVLPNLFFDQNLKKHQISNYYMLDTDISQDQLKFDGITMANDSSKSLINVFKNTYAQENQIAKVSPPDTDGLLSFTFDDYKTFKNNLNVIRPKDSVSDTSFLESVLEAGVIYRKEEQAVFLSTLDAENMRSIFGTQNSTETYKDITIFTSDKPALFSTVFSPLIRYSDATYFINLDDFFVFSDTISLLKDIISSYQNDAALNTSPSYEDMMANLSDASSLFVYASNSYLKALLNSNFDTEKPISPDGYNASALQFVYEKDFAHVHAVIHKAKKRMTPNSVQESANVTLDADVLTDPQFVNNHTNNQKEVVVQDVNNNLYLISKDGSILWKRALDGKILGRIAQIDVHKNGHLQLAFATQKRVYVIDRTGKDVGAFPLKFRDAITQPLSVFDYDNNRNYRLMVTQGSAIILYDKNGKGVPGFNYKKAENTINTQPEHFRIGRKDYIVFVQGKELEILSRVGKTRVNIKNNIDFSDSGIYLYNNKFTTTTVHGDLVQIDQNGKMSSSSLNLGEKHSIASTSKTLVTLSDNILHIKTNKIELDFGNYTPPKIFYVNDKIYVSLTDLQAKKVYLFDSMGKSIPNFPVYGTSSIDLDNIDQQKRPEVVTKGGSNSIIIYQIH